MPASTTNNPALSVPQPRSGSALSVPRPSSTLSVHRPSSSASSSRPRSRLSAHSHARHARSRLIPLAQTLVRRIMGLNDSKDADAATSSDFREAVEFVVKNLEATTLSKGAASVDMQTMDQQISGHSLKARLNSQDEIGEALETCYRNLKEIIDKEHDLDREITQSHLPDHLQFLVKLSSPPTPLTEHHASSILHAHKHPPSPPPALTWASIVAEEPFEGEHWEGVYGLPPGFVRRNETKLPGVYDREKESERIDWDSRWSTPSLSPLNSGDLELDEDQEDEERERMRDQKFGSNRTFEEGNGLGHVDEDAEAYPDTLPTRTPPSHRKTLEDLYSKQYWRKDWKGDVNPFKKTFDISDPSTLGPTLRRVLRPEKDGGSSWSNSLDVLVQNERYINEEDVVREVLMALQGRNNIVLMWQDMESDDHTGGYAITDSTPSMLHFSLDAQASILSSLANTATTIQHLRQFVAKVFADAQSQHLRQHSSFKSNPLTTRTLEAFADAVDQEIRLLDKWCAAREQAMVRAWGGCDPNSASESLLAPSFPYSHGIDPTGRLVISVLSTEKALRDTFDQTFGVLLGIVRFVYPNFDSASHTTSTQAQKSGSPAVTSSALLNQLFTAIQAHLERQEHPVSEALLRVFVCSVEPTWAMTGKWLRDGMGYGITVGSGEAPGIWELEDEFFIESSGLGLGMMGLGLLDPEFWKEGYTLRENVVWVESNTKGESGANKDVDEYGGKEVKRKTIPLFLEHAAELILSAGKSVGLLRALGVSLPSTDDEREGSSDWRSFKELAGLSSLISHNLNGPQEIKEMLFSTSIDMLSRMVYDWLQPRCNRAGVLLAHVLVEDCELWRHLESIEDLFLMRRGDAMSHFTDVLFAKMEAMQQWDDFHFLNTAFRDIVETTSNLSGKEWIQASVVRLAYRGSKDQSRSITRTVRALDGLVVEYAVPFPLIYIFHPAVLQGYSQIFVFLLQIRRAKYVLDQILVRGEEHGQRLKSELKVFYAMRSRLGWFTNTLLDFLTIHVLHAHVLEFHGTFRQAQSLDEMIQLHDNHLDKIRNLCFLKSNTSSLYQAIIAILDLAQDFVELFVTFAGDKAITHDASRQSISMRRHRSRRQRYQRRNVIGFAHSLSLMQDSSDDESEIDDHHSSGGGGGPEHSISMNASQIYNSELEGGFQARMDKLSSELDGLVRFLRRGVESLANGTGEGASACGVLAFALEDWDI